MIELKDIAFIILALITLGSAGGVAFSKKIIYSGFSLLGSLFGVAGLYILLSNDFIAATQLLIYVGGVLILILFAIMLTSKIGDIAVTNKSINWKVAIPIIAGLACFLISSFSGDIWKVADKTPYQSSVSFIGNALLKEFLLPFEVISIVLLCALIGSIVILKREVK
ncbi:MAG: NADH-quinone oxidoreductase subunit J [Deltaproteobacteria bacterium]|nr:MAG: NADH-quinone oxidoreductase subunit J [Deltaproteobacteria bacterium]